MCNGLCVDCCDFLVSVSTLAVCVRRQFIFTAEEQFHSSPFAICLPWITFELVNDPLFCYLHCSDDTDSREHSQS